MRLIYTVTLLVIYIVVFVLSRRYHKNKAWRLHLLGGETKNEGYLGILTGGQWKYLCNAFWDRRNSKVVCRELGYAKAEYGKNVR